VVCSRHSMRGANHWLGSTGFHCLIGVILALMLSMAPDGRASAVEIVTFEEMSPDGPGTGGVIPVMNFYAMKG
jgi:hypothetical protein